MTNNIPTGDERSGQVSPGISPSKFMRELRPEYYSDTRERASYVLNASTLEYHLDTITARNETHEFEIFCRKLCERAICPHLRPQTGPDGGGDSKADTETFPVADEISGLTFLGNANGGRERWAFAFSAKERWKDKVRKDVKGIIETGRAYDRIFCVTSRFAKAKDRACIEDELSKQYGVPVTVHDRSWIVKEIIENDRADLAFHYLNVGESVRGSARLGPTDYRRRQHLDDAERAIADPEEFRGMEHHRAAEALVAAKLSRSLELPRVETDGRFARATRLADAHGIYRQKLEAQYEQIWTAFWWFDDVKFLNDCYDDFAARALPSDNAKNLELLGNLTQLLVNAVLHGHMTREACRLDERTLKLKQALEALAKDPDRPNNSLEAQVGLLRIELNRAIIAGEPEALSPVWRDFARILDKAKGLGEFNAKQLVTFIEVVGQISGNDPTYNELVEKLAAFVGERTSEGEGALILVRRARELDFADRFDMIRWLGKAAIGLSKGEFADAQIETAQLLSLAYRSAGLPWAARASCVLAAASLFIEGEEQALPPVGIVPTMKLWAWNALERCHLPDFLLAMQLLNGFLVGLPLAEDSKSTLRQDIRDLEYALGCLFLNLGQADLRRLEGAPDILEALGLFAARAALLYTLGYVDVLREDGSLPKGETDDSIKELLTILKSQPVAESLRGPLILNDGGPQTFATTILGMRVEVQIDDQSSIPIAEAILGSLEAFFATAILKRVCPHTELFRIIVSQSDSAKEPNIQTNELDMTSVVTWPSGLPVARFGGQVDVQRFFAEMAGHVLGTACVVGDDLEKILDDLYGDDAVRQRIAMIMAVPNSYSRIASQTFSRLSDWQQVVRHSYPLRDQRVELPRIKLPEREQDARETDDADAAMLQPNNHRRMNVSSVIDIHAWEQARWQGCGYVQVDFWRPPYMAFLFENAAAARKIFERWRERFGREDSNEEISVSIIRHLPGVDPLHYCVQIAPRVREDQSREGVLLTTKSIRMEATTNKHLDGFLTAYERFGVYCLIPAVGMVNPEFFYDLAIVKRSLSVKSAVNVLARDIESLALRSYGVNSFS